MIELVLTKEDITHLSIVDAATVVDNGDIPKSAYTITDPDVMDAPGVCRTLAAIGVLDNYEDDSEISYMSYVEGGVLYKISNKRGVTVAELKQGLERVIRETTKPLDVLSIGITKEDCEQVKLHNGKPLWEREGSSQAKLGFTITNGAGQKFVANVPEYLRMPLSRTHLGVTSLAGAAVAIQKLLELPKNAIVDSVHFDLPDTKMNGVSLLPDWYYIGVYHPVRVGELIAFLDGYIRMFTPTFSIADTGREELLRKAAKDLLNCQS